MYVALHEVTWSMVVWCTQNWLRDGSSFMWHQPCQHCKYTTLWIFKKPALKSQSLLLNHLWAQWVCSRERRIALYKWSSSVSLLSLNRLIAGGLVVFSTISRVSLFEVDDFLVGARFKKPHMTMLCCHGHMLLYWCSYWVRSSMKVKCTDTWGTFTGKKQHVLV